MKHPKSGQYLLRRKNGLERFFSIREITGGYDSEVIWCHSLLKFYECKKHYRNFQLHNCSHFGNVLNQVNLILLSETKRTALLFLGLFCWSKPCFALFLTLIHSCMELINSHASWAVEKTSLSRLLTQVI